MNVTNWSVTERRNMMTTILVGVLRVNAAIAYGLTLGPQWPRDVSRKVWCNVSVIPYRPRFWACGYVAFCLSERCLFDTTVLINFIPRPAVYLPF
jgi:hypothetical protein